MGIHSRARPTIASLLVSSGNGYEHMRNDCRNGKNFPFEVKHEFRVHLFILLVDKFKKRLGTRRLKSMGEKKCADYKSATMFVDDFDEIIKNEQPTNRSTMQTKPVYFGGVCHRVLWLVVMNILLKSTRNPSRESKC